MAKKVDYPAFKKALWEGWRVFLPAFLAVLYVQFEAGVDLHNWRSWAGSLVVSAILAGVKALVKWGRDKYGDKDYSRLIYKIPA